MSGDPQDEQLAKLAGLSADLWFIATRDSGKVERIRANPTVGVTVTTGNSCVSISGRAEVVDDTAKAAGWPAW